MRATCSIAGAAGKTENEMTGETGVARRTTKTIMQESTVTVKIMETRKSLLDVNAVQHCLVVKVYKTPPNITSVICVSSQMSRFTIKSTLDNDKKTFCPKKVLHLSSFVVNALLSIIKSTVMMIVLIAIDVPIINVMYICTTVIYHFLEPPKLYDFCTLYKQSVQEWLF